MKTRSLAAGLALPLLATAILALVYRLLYLRELDETPAFSVPILDGASMRVKPGGIVVMEIGETQGERVSEAARGAGFTDIRIAPDLAGRPRYLIATQPLRGE